MTTIEIRGLAELDRKLGRLAAIEVVQRPMRQAVDHLHEVLQVYPPASGKPMQWKSLKQRRWFFANLREGKITIPYKRLRSAGLAGKWVADVRVTGQTVLGVVANGVSYGPFVMGPDTQAQYHQGTWKTTDQIAKEEKAQIVAYFERAIKEALR